MARSGKWALVTGASSGIGAEFSKILAKDGYHLILVARRKEAMESLREAISAQNAAVQIHILPMDLTESGAVDRLLESARSMCGHIDVLVNNAGFGDFGLYLSSEWSVQQKMIQLNITVLAELLHKVGQQMKTRGSGRIINVASVVGFVPAGPLMANYFATKSYVLSLSDAVAQELTGSGVTVTTLCPGATESEFFSTPSMARDSGGRKFAQSLKKIPTSYEVALFGFNSMKLAKRIVVHGFLNRCLVVFLRLLPRELVAKLVLKIQSR